MSNRAPHVVTNKPIPQTRLPLPSFLPPTGSFRARRSLPSSGEEGNCTYSRRRSDPAGHLRSRPWNRLGTNEAAAGKRIFHFLRSSIYVASRHWQDRKKGSNHFNCADFSSENGLYRHNSIALEGSQPVALTPIFSLGVPRSHFYRILPHLLITCSWMLDTLVYVEFTESTISTFLKFTVFDASLAFLPRLENLNQAIRL